MLPADEIRMLREEVVWWKQRLREEQATSLCFMEQLYLDPEHRAIFDRRLRAAEQARDADYAAKCRDEAEEALEHLTEKV